MRNTNPTLLGAFMAVLVMAPVLAMAVFGYWADYRQQVNQAMELAEAVARAGDERISGSLRTIDLLLQYVAEDIGAGSAHNSSIARTLRLQAASMPEIDVLMVADAQGHFLAGSSSPERFADVSGFQFFSVQKRLSPARQVVIDGPLLHEDAPRIVVSRPILGRDGSFQGVAVAVLTPDFFTTPLRQMAPGRVSSAMLLNSNGVVLSQFPEAPYPGVEDLSDRAFMREYQQTGRAGVRHLDQPADDCILVWRPVANYPLLVTVAIPGQQVRAAWTQAAAPKLSIEAGLLLMLALSVSLLYKRGRNLARTAQELETLNSELERRVQKRTASLAAEVSRRRKIEVQLVDARDRAEAASTAKSRFLAVASHDLRQPVQALHLSANVLSGRALDPDSADMVGRIRGSVTSLAELLDSLLDISRLEAGIVRASPRPLPLGAMLDRLWQDFQPQAEDRGVSLSVVTTALWVWSDPALLSRILQNLITNAIRYTPRGGKVLVGCRHHDDRLDLQVLDSGIGIPADQHERIFKEFTQIDSAKIPGNRQGLGLGLAIVRRLCGLLDSPLTLRSEMGRGSAFTLTVPRAAAAPLAAQAAAATPLPSGARILVVDDEPDIRDSLALQLTEWGYVVQVADGADSALALAREHRFDGIIADYGLGQGLSGIELCKQVLELGGREIPVIILTGDTRRERLQAPLPPSFQLLHKPADPHTLRTALGGDMT